MNDFHRNHVEHTLCSKDLIVEGSEISEPNRKNDKEAPEQINNKLNDFISLNLVKEAFVAGNVAGDQSLHRRQNLVNDLF